MNCPKHKKRMTYLRSDFWYCPYCKRDYYLDGAGKAHKIKKRYPKCHDY